MGQDWPACADPLRYFTTFAAALAQASALVPVASDPVGVWAAPGTYPETAAIPGNVHLQAMIEDAAHTVILDGVTYAPTGALDEFASIAGITITSGVSYDASGKTGGASELAFDEAHVTGDISAQGRPATGLDRLVLRDTSVDGSVITIDIVVEAPPGSRIGTGLFMAGNPVLQSVVDNIDIIGSLIVEDQVSVRARGAFIGGSATAGDDATIDLQGAEIGDDVIIATTSAPAPPTPSADLRNATIKGDLIVANVSTVNAEGAVIVGDAIMSGSGDVDMRGSQTTGAVDTNTATAGFIDMRYATYGAMSVFGPSPVTHKFSIFRLTPVAADGTGAAQTVLFVNGNTTVGGVLLFDANYNVHVTILSLDDTTLTDFGLNVGTKATTDFKLLSNGTGTVDLTVLAE